MKKIWEKPTKVPELDAEKKPDSDKEEAPKELTEDEREKARDFDLIDDNDDKEDFVIDPTKYQATFEIYKRVQKSKQVREFIYDCLALIKGLSESLFYVLASPFLYSYWKFNPNAFHIDTQNPIWHRILQMYIYLPLAEGEDRVVGQNGIPSLTSNDFKDVWETMMIGGMMRIFMQFFNFPLMVTIDFINGYDILANLVNFYTDYHIPVVWSSNIQQHFITFFKSVTYYI